MDISEIKKMFTEDMERANLKVIQLPAYLRESHSKGVDIAFWTKDVAEFENAKTATRLEWETSYYNGTFYLIPLKHQRLVTPVPVQRVSSHQPLVFASTTKWEQIDVSSDQETLAMELPDGVLIRHVDKRYGTISSSMVHVPFVTISDLKAKLKK